MTFLEAYKKTGRILNISVCPDEARAVSKQLNYITAPDVVINTAVSASSAIPGVVNAVELLMKTPDGNLVPFHGAGKKWRDGSLQADIPEKELHHLFNVNYTIVSQTNPHITLFFYERNGSAGSPTAHRYGRGW
jgi:predicted acylesterase/phospholipase RssA